MLGLDRQQKSQQRSPEVPLRCQKRRTNQNMCVCLFPPLLVHSLGELPGKSPRGKSPRTDQIKKKPCLMLRWGRRLRTRQFYYTHFFPPKSFCTRGDEEELQSPPRQQLPKGEATPHPRCQAPSSDTAGDGRAAIKPGSRAGPPRGAVPGCTGLYRAVPSRRETVPRRERLYRSPSAAAAATQPLVPGR